MHSFQFAASVVQEDMWLLDNKTQKVIMVGLFSEFFNIVNKMSVIRISQKIRVPEWKTAARIVSTKG